MTAREGRKCLVFYIQTIYVDLWNLSGKSKIGPKMTFLNLHYNRNFCNVSNVDQWHVMFRSVQVQNCRSVYACMEFMHAYTLYNDVCTLIRSFVLYICSAERKTHIRINECRDADFSKASYLNHYDAIAIFGCTTRVHFRGSFTGRCQIYL